MLMIKSEGGCHCGMVRFEIEMPQDIVVQECNCSICSKSGFLHLIVPRTHFSLISGEETLTTYTFNTGVAKHLFCKICGVKSFYVPRSNPDGYSVNLRCIDKSPFRNISIELFDGQNWEASGHLLSHLSKG
ncbi:GFA family protein [Pseudomonadota bacterium]